METSLLATSQNAYSAALQKQAAVVAAGQKQTAAAAAGGSGANSANLSKVKDAAQKFEAFFAGQMMDSMTEGLETDEYFGGGHGEDMWRSMLNQEYGKQMAKSGGLGIADSVMKSMLQAQEQRSSVTGAPTATAAATASTAAATDDAPAATQTAIAITPAMRRALKGMSQ